MPTPIALGPTYLDYAKRQEAVNITLPPYSVDSTGETDIAAAFQSAVDTIGAAGGGVVYFPRGIFRLNSVINVTYSNVTIMGAGLDATKIATGVNANTVNMIKFGAAGRPANQGLRDLSLYGDPRITGVSGSDAKWRQHGVVVDYTSNCRIIDVRVDHFAGAGICFDNTFNADGPDETFLVRVRANVNAYGFKLDKGHSTKVQGGLADFNSIYGIYIADRNSVYISGTDIESNSGTGICIGGGCNDIDISTCSFENNASSAGNTDDKHHIIIGPFNVARAVRIHDNYFKVITGGATNMRHLIRVDDVEGCDIQRNFCADAGDFASAGNSKFVYPFGGANVENLVSERWYVEETPNAVDYSDRLPAIDVTRYPYFAKGDGTTDSLAAFQAAVSAAVKTGQRIAVPAGTYSFSGTLNFPYALQLEGQGLVKFTKTGATGGYFLSIVKPSAITGNVLEESGFTSNSGEIRGIIFKGRSATDKGVYIGEGDTVPDGMGAGFRFRRCGFETVLVGITTENNIWCTGADDCWFQNNTNDVDIAGTANCNENLTFSNCTFANATGYSNKINGGQGTGVTYRTCSFDYCEGSIFLLGNHITVDLHSCWFEHNTGTPCIQATAALIGNTINIFGGTYVNAHPSGTYSAELIFNQEVTCRISGMRFVDVFGTDDYSGPRIITMSDATSSVIVPFVIYHSESCIPRVTPIDSVGTTWWVDPLYTGSHHFFEIKTAAAVSGAKRFVVDL